MAALLSDDPPRHHQHQHQHQHHKTRCSLSHRLLASAPDPADSLSLSCCACLQPYAAETVATGDSLPLRGRLAAHYETPFALNSPARAYRSHSHLHASLLALTRS